MISNINLLLWFLSYKKNPPGSKAKLPFGWIRWIELLILLIDPNCDSVLVGCSTTSVWYTVCKTGCDTRCLTVCTLHKDSLLWDNGLFTKANLAYTRRTGAALCRFSVCLNVESLVWQNQVRFFLPPLLTGSCQNIPATLTVPPAGWVWRGQNVNIIKWIIIIVIISDISNMTGVMLSDLHILLFCLSGSGSERDACSDAVQGYHVDSAVHQKLLPVGECSEEPASLPGEVL